MSDRVIHVLAGEIVKANRRDDGTVEFLTSKAAGPELDIDSQILDPKWLGKEMPEWFETGGNLREMHQPIAAGVATSIEERPDGYYIAGDVVDPGSATKVEKGILRQLSVGIKGARIVKDAAAPGGRVVGGKIVEVSLVDRAANSSCKLVLAKAASPDAKVEHVEELTEPEVTEASTIRAAIAKVAGGTDAADALAHLAARDAALTKHATPDQAALLASAMRSVSRLIASEASEMATTGNDEISDLRLLLDAVSALKWFSISETNEPTSEEDDMPLTLAALTDLVKGATPDEKAKLAAMLAPAPADPDKPVEKGAAPDDKTPTDPPAPLNADKLKSDIIDAVKAALADTKKGVDDALAEVKKMAAPGGPVRMASSTNKGAEPDDKAAKRAYYERQASLVDDPVMVAGYRAKAAALDA